MRSILLAALLLPLCTSAMARDDGRYAGSPLKPWFDSLHSGKGPCCSDADGAPVGEGDWESRNGRFRVFVEGVWVDVPPEALVDGPNLAGRTMVWLQHLDGHPVVRCFLPGTMT